jgi:hypothetical protein
VLEGFGVGKRNVQIVHPERSNVGRYDSDDLNNLEEILEEILGELVEQRSPSVSAENAAATRLLLAAALFKVAGSGERDRDRLKREALASLKSVPAEVDAVSRRAQ